MSKQTRWLSSEVDRWTAEGIVSLEQAARIRALYVEPAGALSWGLIVFFGLGAVIVGLGVTLLLAYNWDDIPKFGKLALILGLTALAHAGGLRFRIHPDWRAQLGEALSLLGTMMFGAGIWLVAQVYHIDEHFPNGFLVWALGALAMAWALDSIVQGVLATILFAIWGGAETLRFHSPAGMSALAIVIGIGPLFWRRRSAVLLATIVAAMYWLMLVNASYWAGSAGVFGNAFALAVLLIALAKLIGEDFGRCRGVLAFFGWSGFILCAYILSFDSAARGALHWTYRPDVGVLALVYRWLLFVLTLAAWGWLAWRARRGEREPVPREEWLCPIALLYAQGLRLFQRGEAGFVAVVFNLVCLALAAAWMVRGCREGRLRPTVVGSLLLSAVLLARYFDLFDSLALRGVAFLILGGVLFAEGFYYRKLRRAEAEGGA
ncbi:MAG TPA: DUF2157 domain-containing protein [Opitutaceae bacterium]|nr:DUF2157 domain-containing protein [Opitutaceae bacterium]